MSSVDTNAWTRPDPSGGDPNRDELPYVLVADTNVERAALCPRDVRPGIAVGRMQPAAAEVDGDRRAEIDRP